MPNMLSTAKTTITTVSSNLYSRPAQSTQNRVSVVQHEGCRSARACATLSPPRWTHAAAAAQGRTQSTAAAQQPWCSTPALAKRAQLRPARTLGKADVHCSDSAVRRTFCTNCEPFAAHPRVEKNTCAKRRHNLEPRAAEENFEQCVTRLNPRERRQQVNDIGARANGLLKHACNALGCPAEL